MLLHLPEIGISGHTRVPFSGLNTLQVADLLLKYLRENRLDKR